MTNNLQTQRARRDAVTYRMARVQPAEPVSADLDAFLRTADLPAELEDLVRQTTEYRDRDRAPSTRVGYARTWAAFCDWVEGYGQTACPAAPEMVALYIAHLADHGGHSGHGRRPGTIRNHLSAIAAHHTQAGHADPTSHPLVQRVLAGIKRSKGVRVQPREPMTYQLLAKVIFTLDLRHSHRAAIDRVLLSAMALEVTAPPDPDRVVGLTTAQLASLDWQHVTFQDDDTVLVRVRRRSGRGAHVEVRLIPAADEELCLATALREMCTATFELLTEAERTADASLLSPDVAASVRRTWQRQSEPGTPAGKTSVAPAAHHRSGETAPLKGPVMPRLDRYGLPAGGRSSRQALNNLIGRLSVSIDLTHRRGQHPDWTEATLRRALEVSASPSLQSVRDRALLLLGWHLAARRSNLTWLRVGEVKRGPTGSGLEVLFRRSKTDQQQAGRTLVVGEAKSAWMCPVRAWWTWRERLQTALREEANDSSFALDLDFPAFPPLTKDGMSVGEPRELFDARGDGSLVLDTDGNPVSLGLEGLTGATINALVRQRAHEAGLVQDVDGRPLHWGGHSLRRGWLTTGARKGIPLEQMMAHSGHVSHESVLLYIQEANKWDERHSAALKLARRLDEQRMEP